MVNANISYSCIEGSPEVTILKDMEELYNNLFDDANLPFFRKRFEDHPESLSILAFNRTELIALKIGYPYSETTFYSWVGGVSFAYRKLGIATKLAELQEIYAKENGFTKLRTKSMNRFKPMMALNLKNGFDITEVYTNSSGQTKIIFEKVMT